MELAWPPCSLAERIRRTPAAPGHRAWRFRQRRILPARPGGPASSPASARYPTTPVVRVPAASQAEVSSAAGSSTCAHAWLAAALRHNRGATSESPERPVRFLVQPREPAFQQFLAETLR